MMLKSFQNKQTNSMSKTELPSLAFWQSALFWILFQDICWGQVSFPCIPTGLGRSEVAQSCPTLCDPMDSSLHQAPPSMGFSRQEYWSGLPFPSPGNLPDTGMNPGLPICRRFTVWPTREVGTDFSVVTKHGHKGQHFFMRHTLAGGSWLTTLISVELLTVVYLFKVYRNLIQLYIDI